MKAVFHWCQKTRYLCDWSVAKADRLNHHHVELHLRLCGQDYLAGQNDLRIIKMMLIIYKPVAAVPLRYKHIRPKVV